MWKLFQLFVAVGLIIGGLLFLILWEHPMSAVWTDPVSIFWDTQASELRINRIWFIGPMLIFAGAAWIAEDWFNFGVAKPSSNTMRASPSEKQQAALEYERDQPKLPPAST